MDHELFQIEFNNKQQLNSNALRLRYQNNNEHTFQTISCRLCFDFMFHVCHYWPRYDRKYEITYINNSVLVELQVFAVSFRSESDSTSRSKDVSGYVATTVVRS